MTELAAQGNINSLAQTGQVNEPGLAHPAAQASLVGVETLMTGDILIKADGVVTLVTPSADRITIHPTGKHTIEGKLLGADRDKNGVSTVCFKDNSIIKLDKGGILEISRNGHVLKFPRSEQHAIAEESKEVADENAAMKSAVEPAESEGTAQEAPPEKKLAEPKAAMRSNPPTARVNTQEASKKFSNYELPGLDIL